MSYRESETKKELQRRLNEKFKPSVLEIHDETHLHRHHGAGLDKGGNFTIGVVSDVFDGMNRVKRQQAVFELIDENFRREIHALSMKLMTPEEFKSRGGF